MGRGDDAIAHLESLMKQRPDDVEVVMALGNVQRSRKKFAEAAETYDKAIKLIGQPERGHWILYFYRGTSYERAKQWDKARPTKKALELVPEAAGRPGAGDELSRLFLGRPEHEHRRGLQDAHKAVELAPRDGMIIDSLGWAYFRMGRYDDAARELEKAVELKPGDPTINDHLGDAYWKVGRKVEAKFQWDHAKTSDPEHEELVKILKKIDNGLEEDPKPAVEGEKAVAPPT